MQELVARYPELITDGDGELLLVRREQAISDGEHGVGRWSLDHLFVTRNAVPVLVELKRAVDTRLRREVVGQMLDYAANATAYWQAGEISERFARTCIESGLNPDEAIIGFIGEQDPDAFWEQVDSNFKAGRIKLVFVADEIPSELARVVEFLNDQMRADVRAIELRWFSGENGVVTLSPRVIGETERAAAAKRSTKNLQPINVEEWIEQRIAPAGNAAKQGAHAFIRCIEELGGIPTVSSGQGSVYAVITGQEGKPIYPVHLWPEKASISFSLRWLHSRPQLTEESIRRELLGELRSIVGPLTTENLKGFPAFQAELLSNPNSRDKFRHWLDEVFRLARMPS